MSIWVRTQKIINDDGKLEYQGLVRCNYFAIIKYYDYYAIDGSMSEPSGEDSGFRLGKYPTEEEALKVLDMIQKQIFDIWSAAPEERQYTGPIFQMPPAGFSTEVG